MIDLIDDLAVIRRILSHLGLWRERKGNERGTALLEEPASDADLVYEPVDDGRPGSEEPTDRYHQHQNIGWAQLGVRLRIGLRTAFSRLNRPPICRKISKGVVDGPESFGTLNIASGVGRVGRVPTPISASSRRPSKSGFLSAHVLPPGWGCGRYRRFCTVRVVIVISDAGEVPDQPSTQRLSRIGFGV
jgi:hypothetical protein